MRHISDSGKDVTRQQAQSEPVRVVKNDRVVDCQAGRDRFGNRALFGRSADNRQTAQTFPVAALISRVQLMQMSESIQIRVLDCTA